jgi:hypothetical protein
MMRLALVCCRKTVARPVWMPDSRRIRATASVIS